MVKSRLKKCPRVPIFCSVHVYEFNVFFGFLVYWFTGQLVFQESKIPSQ